MYLHTHTQVQAVGELESSRSKLLAEMCLFLAAHQGCHMNGGLTLECGERNRFHLLIMTFCKWLKVLAIDADFIHTHDNSLLTCLPCGPRKIVVSIDLS